MEGLRNSIILGVSLYTLRYAPALFFIGVIVAIIYWLISNVAMEQEYNRKMNEYNKKNGDKK